MTKENVLGKLGFIMTGDEINRIKVSENESGVSVLVDLHELRKPQAMRFLKNILNLITGPFRLSVIHGYNHGTVLKNYVNNELQNKRIRERHVLPNNLGVTVLSIN